MPAVVLLTHSNLQTSCCRWKVGCESSTGSAAFTNCSCKARVPASERGAFLRITAVGHRPVCIEPAAPVEAASGAQSAGCSCTDLCLRCVPSSLSSLSNSVLSSWFYCTMTCTLGHRTAAVDKRTLLLLLTKDELGTEPCRWRVVSWAQLQLVIYLYQHMFDLPPGVAAKIVNHEPLRQNTALGPALYVLQHSTCFLHALHRLVSPAAGSQSARPHLERLRIHSCSMHAQHAALRELVLGRGTHPHHASVGVNPIGVNPAVDDVAQRQLTTNAEVKSAARACCTHSNDTRWGLTATLTAAVYQ